MLQILSLALPFFGLIALGYGAGKIVKIDESGLRWLNTFIIYIALPALFFQLVSRTPIEELANGTYIATTTFATYAAFALAFAVGAFVTRGDLAQATMQGIAGAYSNVGYMGPGLTLAALGPSATVPTALIFCFDSALLFTLAPLMMAVAGSGEARLSKTLLSVVKKVFLHPFILATLAGVLAAATGFRPPEAIDRMLNSLMGAAAPCALFAMGVTVALRPLKRISVELPALLTIKLVFHPLLVWLLLAWIGGFDPVWIYTAVLMASLPPALNVFIIARQYGIYVERASSVVLLGTLASIVTLTSVLALVATGTLPVNPFE